MDSDHDPSADISFVGATLALPANGKWPRRRNSLRYDGFDYRSHGAYLITIVVACRSCVFSSITNGDVSLTRRGMVIEDCWEKIPSHRPNVRLDAFVVMPNHIHGILWIEGREDVGRLPVSGLAAGSLGAVVGGFKSAASREINRLKAGAANGLWQRGFHDRIIRDARELDAIRNYVLENPANWDCDEHNPHATRTVSFEASLRDALARAGDASVAPTKTESVSTCDRDGAR